MRLGELTDMASLERARAPWEALASRASSPLPYVTPAFALPWLRALDPSCQIRVLTAWEGDQMIGLAPLVQRRRGRLGVSLQLWSFPIRGTSPPFEFMFADRAGAIVDAFVAHWRRTGGWDLIELPGLPSGSETARALKAAAARQNLAIRSSEARRSVVVRIKGAWPEYFSARSAMHRQNCRRAWRRCEARGPTRLVRYPDELEFDRACEMASRVIDRSWKRFGDDGAHHARFFADLRGELRAAGMLSLRFLVVDEVPIGYLLEVRHGDTLHAFHIAYDLAFQHESPGILLLEDGIRDAHVRGLSSYDLGGGAEYLRRWSDAALELETLVMTPPSRVSAIKAGLYLRMRARKSAAARRETDRIKESRKASARAATPPGPHHAP